MLEKNKIYLGDCLEKEKNIESGSVDLILTDLPYGNMNTDGGRKLGINGWDYAIEPKKIFEISNRILRKNGKIVLFSQEPYTTKLINESIPNLKFNYRAIWEKENFANCLGCNKNMVNCFEDILIFTKLESCSEINPLKKIMKKYINKYGKHYIVKLFEKEGRYSSRLSAKVHASYKFGFNNGMRFDLMDIEMYNFLKKFIDFDESYEELKEINDKFKLKVKPIFNLWEGNKYKSNILKYKKDYINYHPTQKPILLLEDLIKTFTNEKNLIVDLTCGSGNTCIASSKNNRNYIGIEKDETYYNIACKRIEEHKQQLKF